MFHQFDAFLVTLGLPHGGFISILVLTAVAVIAGIFLIPWLISLILTLAFHSERRQTILFWWRKHLWPARFLFLGIILLSARPFFGVQGATSAFIDESLALWFIGDLAWLALAATSAIRHVILKRYNISEADNLRARRVMTQVRVIQRIVTLAILVLAAAAALMTFAQVRQFGISLLASAGVVGLILGVAAQKTMGNIFAGLQVAFAQPIRLDDVVVVEGEWGNIEEITLSYVVVKIWDERRLILPMSYFIDQPFENWTRTSSSILGTVFVYADYSVPVTALREELKRIVTGSPLWDKRVQLIQVTDSTEHTLQLRALVSAASSSAAWDLRCEVREGLISYLQENNPECLPRTRIEL